MNTVKVVKRMKLKLVNFKIFENREFEFPDTGIVLLNGENGVGKSTIFAAIVFAFYGIGNKLVTWEKKRCLVTLIFKDLKIKRGKSPKIFKVVFKGTEIFNSDEAQEIIDKELGMGVDLFLKTSYIQQKKISNLFLSLSQTERLKLIHTISFNGESSVYKKPISDELKKLNNQVLKEETQLESLKSIFDENEEEQVDVDVNRNFDDDISEEYDNIQSLTKLLENKKLELTKKKSQIQKIKDKRQEHEKYIKMIEEQKENLVALNSRLTDYENELDMEKLNSCTLKLKQVNTEKDKIRDLLDLINDYIRTSTLYEKHKKDIKDKILETKTQLGKYQSLEVLENLYNEIFLNEENKKRKNQAKQNISGLFKEIKKLDHSLQDVKSVKKMIQLLKEIRECIRVFQCPNCEKFISVNSENKTSLATATKNKYSKIKKGDLDRLYISLEKENRDWSLSIKIFDKSLEQVKEELDTVRKLTNDLQRYTLSNDDLSFTLKLQKITENGINKHKINFGKVNTDKLLQDKSIVFEAITREKEKLEKSIGEMSSLKIKHNECKKKVQKLKEEIKSKTKVEIEDDIKLIETLNSDITLLSRDIADDTSKILERKGILEDLEMKKRAVEYKIQMSKIKELSITLKKSKEMLRGYQTLKDIDKQAELLTVRQTINKINEIANRYMSIFFSNPISVNLIESEDATKIMVQVSCKGQVFDTVDILSGGEIQRCDLSFLFGINEMNNGQIILLDECFSFISGEGHETIISNLEKICGEKLIILVSHRAVEGNFNSVVDL
jgi:DNA repair exonuclease SbcCD ATPase subunit